ncbi:MAG: lysophospholipid acyltransferase family protein [Candidatus Methylacidiphilales bacterium]|nr:lysophospholipid acyltransferase family protein [Candidatus Methylacidiphilales bacterium]
MAAALLSHPTTRDSWSWWAARTVCWLVFGLVARVRVCTEVRLPAGPYLIACNHISHFDPPVAGVCTRRKVDFMAMRELFAHPLPAWVLTHVCDAFPVSRDRQDTSAVRTAVRRLRAGRIVFVFPEGGIRSGAASVLGGAPLPAGVASLAQMAGVGVRPAVILGTDQIYRWWSLWRRPRVLVAFGEELRLDPAKDAAAAREDLNGRLRDAWFALHTLLRQQPDYHPGLEPRTAQERWQEPA